MGNVLVCIDFLRHQNEYSTNVFQNFNNGASGNNLTLFESTPVGRMKLNSSRYSSKNPPTTINPHTTRHMPRSIDNGSMKNLSKDSISSIPIDQIAIIDSHTKQQKAGARGLGSIRRSKGRILKNLQSDRREGASILNKTQMPNLPKLNKSIPDMAGVNQPSTRSKKKKVIRQNLVEKLKTFNISGIYMIIGYFCML